MKILSVYVVIMMLALALSNCRQAMQNTFYVDSKQGNDQNCGSIDEPFQSIDKALSVVSDRVERGILSDKIFMREGVYRKKTGKTLYQLNLKGTADNFALFSAMPCDSTYPGAVKRKSGHWYEKVVFDDAWEVSTNWTPFEKNKEVWQTSPGYTHLEWTHKNLWPWTLHGFPKSKNDDTPSTTGFTVAPYMLLVDDQPSIWVNSLDSLTQPGQHFYDHFSRLLYVYPPEAKNPNTCKIETWYGGEEYFEIGTLHLDGEGRALFDGNLKYAAIKGFEFRMFNKLFELHRRKYHSVEDRVIQQDVLFEDNHCCYGWIQILLDANTVLDSLPGVIRPRYEDRARWKVRNNVFYRPSREVCQLHGDDHIFEDNVIIDHLGPWAGPAACVSAVNTRNTRNFLVRNNYFAGQGNNKFHSGSVFMIESGSNHADENGDYIFSGQTYKNNLIANVSSGPAFVMGKGGARLRNITIEGNIVSGNKESPAILIGSPHTNLAINGNIFYKQNKLIGISRPGAQLNYHSLPSTINFSNNLIVACDTLFDEGFLKPVDKSQININRNIFDRNAFSPLGDQSIVSDPKFYNVNAFDFRIGNKELKYLEVLNAGFWKNIRDNFPNEIKQE